VEELKKEFPSLKSCGIMEDFIFSDYEVDPAPGFGLCFMDKRNVIWQLRGTGNKD